MIKNKFILLSMNLILILVFLFSCTNYNARIYSHAESDMILESFLEENRVKGSYINKNYIEGVDDYEDRHYIDETSPSERIFIIDNENSFKSIFIENSLDVNFENEIIYLYIFSDCSPRDYYIKDISIENDKVIISLKLANKNVCDTVELYQRALVVVMDKTNTSTVEFIEP